jgi:hypothetical protein
LYEVPKPPVRMRACDLATLCSTSPDIPCSHYRRASTADFLCEDSHLAMPAQPLLRRRRASKKRYTSDACWSDRSASFSGASIGTHPGNSRLLCRDPRPRWKDIGIRSAALPCIARQGSHSIARSKSSQDIPNDVRLPGLVESIPKNARKMSLGRVSVLRV